MKTFWFILTIAALLWYIFITAFVGFKGIGDIKSMLKRLSDQKLKDDQMPD
jgi:cell division protein FtsB